VTLRGRLTLVAAGVVAVVVALAIGGTAEHPLVAIEDFASDSDLVAAAPGLHPDLPAVPVDGEWAIDWRGDDVRLRKVGTAWIAIVSPPPAAARAYPDARTIYVFTGSTTAAPAGSAPAR